MRIARPLTKNLSKQITFDQPKLLFAREQRDYLFFWHPQRWPSAFSMWSGCGLMAGIKSFAATPAAWRCWPRSAAPSLRWQWHAFSSPGKTAMTKPSAPLDPLRTSSEPDRRSRFCVATLGLCSRHKNVRPLHPAGPRHQDRPRPVPVRVS